MSAKTQTEKIISEVRDYIVNRILIGVGDGQLGPDDSFLQRGILNSTGVLDLVSFLEETYSIQCTDEEITPENLDSLNRIGVYVHQKLAAQLRP
ncbi:MAG: acyl carrier protein [Acidobacteriota bacterium]